MRKNGIRLTTAGTPEANLTIKSYGEAETVHLQPVEFKSDWDKFVKRESHLVSEEVQS